MRKLALMVSTYIVSYRVGDDLWLSVCDTELLFCNNLTCLAVSSLLLQLWSVFWNH